MKVSRIIAARRSAPARMRALRCSAYVNTAQGITAEIRTSEDDADENARQIQIIHRPSERGRHAGILTFQTRIGENAHERRKWGRATAARGRPIRQPAFVDHVGHYFATILSHTRLTASWKWLLSGSRLISTPAPLGLRLASGSYLVHITRSSAGAGARTRATSSRAPGLLSTACQTFLENPSIWETIDVR